MATTRCVGLIGGLGPGSAAWFYRQIVAAAAGRGAALDLVMINADTRRVMEYSMARDMTGLAGYLAGLLGRLKAAGADFAAIPALTPHLCAGQLLPVSPLPLINPIDLAVAEIRARGLKRVGLLGTRFTLESRFFGQLEGIETIVPAPEDVLLAHETYLQITGDHVEPQRALFQRLAESLCQRGAESVVLAGTELALLFDESNCNFPHVDCARLHLSAIVAAL